MARGFLIVALAFTLINCTSFAAAAEKRAATRPSRSRGVPLPIRTVELSVFADLLVTAPNRNGYWILTWNGANSVRHQAVSVGFQGEHFYQGLEGDYRLNSRAAVRAIPVGNGEKYLIRGRFAVSPAAGYSNSRMKGTVRNGASVDVSDPMKPHVMFDADTSIEVRCNDDGADSDFDDLVFTIQFADTLRNQATPVCSNKPLDRGNEILRLVSQLDGFWIISTSPGAYGSTLHQGLSFDFDGPHPITRGTYSEEQLTPRGRKPKLAKSGVSKTGSYFKAIAGGGMHVKGHYRYYDSGSNWIKSAFDFVVKCSDQKALDIHYTDRETNINFKDEASIEFRFNDMEPGQQDWDYDDYVVTIEFRKKLPANLQGLQKLSDVPFDIGTRPTTRPDLKTDIEWMWKNTATPAKLVCILDPQVFGLAVSTDFNGNVLSFDQIVQLRGLKSSRECVREAMSYARQGNRKYAVLMLALGQCHNPAAAKNIFDHGDEAIEMARSITGLR